LKILLVGPSYPYRGGIANFNDSLYIALKNKHDTRIVSYSLQYPSFLFPGASQYEKSDSQGRDISERLINSINPFTWSAAADEILGKKPDCLIVHYWMPFFSPALGTIIRRVKRKPDICVIGLLHNIKPHEGMVAAGKLNRYFLKSCDGFITMSATVTDELRRTGIEKPVRQIPHPVYEIFGKNVSKKEASVHLKLDPNDNHLLFFGMIRPYKGLDLLLKALGSPKLSHIKLKLIVAGEFYENEKKYLALAEEAGPGKEIIFTRSFVPENEVGYYFSASDLVVQPYLSATQSGVTQIAYHYNKPVVVTGVGGLKEMVYHERTGYVCQKDPDEIAAAIADFFDNNRSSEFIENVKTEKKKFSWNAMVDGIEGISAEIYGRTTLSGPDNPFQTKKK
jgi:D-inositol-3-phosphate glycosyltransferase